MRRDIWWTTVRQLISLTAALGMGVAALPANAHVSGVERAIPLGANVRGELLDCLQDQYRGVTCRIMVTNEGSTPTKSLPLCVVGSRLTTPALDQQNFSIFQTTDARAQFGNRECLIVPLDPSESTLVKLSVSPVKVPTLEKGAIFPELKLMVGDKAVYFSDIPNKLR